MNTTRREFIKYGIYTGSMFAGVLGTFSSLSCSNNNNIQQKEFNMAHELPPLPYAYDAFTEVIDEQTMKLHHDIHHNGYVTGLNNAEAGLAAARESGDYKAVKSLQKEAAFHGSGHALHTVFWNNLSPNGGGAPSGTLGDAINKTFGDFDKFKAHFKASTNGVEGSGWGILAYNVIFNDLTILQVEKHHDVTQFGAVPLLAIDVWEHAYYLKYQNKRPAYTENIFNIINWDDVASRFAAVAK